MQNATLNILKTAANGAVTYYRIKVTDVERTEKMLKIFFIW